MKQHLSSIILLIMFVLTMFMGACSWKDVPMPKRIADTFGIIQQEEEEALKIERYDIVEYRYLLTGDFSALQKMQSDYPMQTRLLIENFLKIGEIDNPGIYKKLFTYYQDTTLQRVIKDVDIEYGNMINEQRLLNKVFQNLRSLIPTINIPVVYTQVGDFGESIAINGDAIGISLDKYLGTDYTPYLQYFNLTQRKEMTREYIVPDCLTFYLLSKYPLKNFEKASQEQRDHHIQCIWWIVNSALERDFYKNINVSRVEALELIH